VLPRIFLPPKSAASTRPPRDGFPALTTNTPSGRSTNVTSPRGSNPCLRRMAGGMVTCPLLVIFMGYLSLNVQRVSNMQLMTPMDGFIYRSRVWQLEAIFLSSSPSRS